MQHFYFIFALKVAKMMFLLGAGEMRGVKES